MPLVIALVDRVYRSLLALYPAAFRLQHGNEMALDFADAAASARHAAGWRGLLAHWGRALIDLAVTIAQQWLRTFWPIIGLLSMITTLVGFSAALRFIPSAPYQMVVRPEQQELALLLMLLVGALIPIFGVVIFCGCFLRPNLDRTRRRRRV